MKRVYKVIILICLILIIASGIYFAVDFLFVVKIKYNGDKEVFIDANDDYKDSGIKIYFRGKENKVDVSNNLDTTKLGKYYYTYTSNINNKTYNLKRTINVIDRKKPLLILNGKNRVYINYDSEYEEEGFVVTDNFDKDLSDKVVSEIINKSEEGYQIKYYVKDTSGNETVVFRNIIYKDMTPPIIEFKNNIDTYLIIGSDFDFNDYTAKDDVDGDITDKVVISGSVDNTKEGTYKILYTVSDSSNNKTTIERKIVVGKKNKKGIPVLMYHWFYDNTKGEKPGEKNTHNYISKTEFTNQMNYLIDNNYYFPTLKELLDYIDGKIELPERSVVITDDDGVESFYKVAMPILQEKNINAVSFVITDKEPWKKYRNEKNIIFASHTASMHVRSCNKKWDGKAMCSSYDDLLKDTKKSLEFVSTPLAFAYPFGHYSDDYIKALKDSGINMAFTINDGKVKKGANKMKLPRVRISKGCSIKSFASKL